MYGSSIDFAEVRFFPFDDKSSINPDILQKRGDFGTRHGFSYQMLESDTFCPFSILSDIGTIWFDHSPQNKTIKFKSVKIFFNSFRNVEIFKKYVKSWIYNGFNPLLDPE